VPSVLLKVADERKIVTTVREAALNLLEDFPDARSLCEQLLAQIVPQSLLRFEATFRCHDGAWRIAMLHVETFDAKGGDGHARRIGGGRRRPVSMG
jgi:hypothetical protein